jgi:hypothetical protein
MHSDLRLDLRVRKWWQKHLDKKFYSRHVVVIVVVGVLCLCYDCDSMYDLYEDDYYYYCYADYDYVNGVTEADDDDGGGDDDDDEVVGLVEVVVLVWHMSYYYYLSLPRRQSLAVLCVLVSRDCTNYRQD